MSKILPILLISLMLVFGCTQTPNTTTNDNTNATENITEGNSIENAPMESGIQPEDESVNPGNTIEQPGGTIENEGNSVNDGTATTEPDTSVTEPEPTPEAVEFYLEANDSGFYDEGGAKVTEITVPAGAQVNINFYIRDEGTYYGGMTIRGPGFDSGKIEKKGTYIAEFTANQSGEIKSYWPLTNKLKATLKVTVQ